MVESTEIALKDCRIVVAGLRACGSGYPNAERTIAILGGCSNLKIDDLGSKISANARLWSVSKNGPWAIVTLGLRMIFGNILSALRVLSSLDRRIPWLVYVPYPAIPFLCLMRLLPRRWRPYCVADAYISIWDAAFRDRRAERAQGLLSRLVKKIEGWALGAAAIVTVDTEANKAYYREMFGLPSERLVSLPLAVDSSPFVGVRKLEPDIQLRSRVLFIGTLIPLHGIEVILAAARSLRNRDDLTFVVVGDGQLGHKVEEAVRDPGQNNLEWHREWCSLEQLAGHVKDATVCLGVFGGAGKASRVLPYKLYYYLAAGKAVLSQRGLSLPENLPPPPIHPVDGSQMTDMAAQLAESILRLVDTPTERRALEIAASGYFDRYLDGRAVLNEWSKIVEGLPGHRK